MGRLSIEKRLLFLMPVTNLRSGMGSAISGAVDNPIQRGGPAGLPLIRGSSIKGSLSSRYFNRMGKKGRDEKKVWAPIFGALEESAASFNVLDAYLLLFPVASLQGGYAYVTSPSLLNRFARIAHITGEDSLADKALSFRGGEPFGRECYVEEGSSVLINIEIPQGDGCVIIEPLFVLKPAKKIHKMSELAKALVERIQKSDMLLKIQGHVVLLSDDMLNLVLEHTIPVTPRVRLRYKEKTVRTGPWWEEALPKGTLLYTAFIARESRVPFKREILRELRKLIPLEELSLELSGGKAEIRLKPSHIFRIVLEAEAPLYLFLGANESSGRGLVEVIW